MALPPSLPSVFRGFGLGALLASAMTARAESPALSLRSGPDRVALVELYTSEGCSSCPPADAWLNRLRAAPGLWTEFVPVAWHVDYWDQLGWKDRHATPDYTARQRAYAAKWNSRSVYTPCLAVAGGETMDWRTRRSPSRPEGKPGVLIAELVGEQVVVSFERAAEPLPAELEAHAVRLAFGEVSVVTDGENKGKSLPHDFLPASWAHRRMAPSGNGWTVALRPARPAGKPSALAVWVSKPGDPEPIQAVGGWVHAPEPAAP